jgi:maleate isomerase
MNTMKNEMRTAITFITMAGLLAQQISPAQARDRIGATAAPPTEQRAPHQILTGTLSGRTIRIPAVNAPPMPALAPSGLVYNGKPAAGFGGIAPERGYPDVRSYRRKFGLVIPATNTSMEHELWSLIFANQGVRGLRGVGLHTANVITPNPKLATPDDLVAYQQQFLGGLKSAVDTALQAAPEYMILGMSLEHVVGGLDAIRAPVKELAASSGLGWAATHEAMPAALRQFRARRIGLLTPFDKKGNENAQRMFEELGFEVVATVGFSCANAMHIAHIPDWAKEKAIVELLATAENRLDAVVQCGTNMSLLDVTEKLEPVIGIPILGVNAVLFWYALRENGFTDPLAGGGRLLREF